MALHLRQAGYQTGEKIDLPKDAVKRVFKDFTAKNKPTAYLQKMPYMKI